MSIKPPLTDLPIKTADRGFYSGFSVDVTVSSKLAVGGLVLWAVAFPEQAWRRAGGVQQLHPVELCHLVCLCDGRFRHRLPRAGPLAEQRRG